MLKQLDDRLATLGVVIESAANRRISLNDPDHVWVVRSGELDVFYAWRDAETELTGRLHPLMRLNPSEALFGLDLSFCEKSFHLTGIGVEGTSLVQINRNDFERLLQEAQEEAWVRGLLEPWFLKLSAVLVSGGQPTRHLAMPVPEERKVAAGLTVLPNHGMAWFASMQGDVCYLGRNELILPKGYFLPISDRTWLETRTTARLQSLTTVQMLRAGDCWKHVDCFHEMALRCFLKQHKDDQEREHRRLETKIEHNDNVMRKAVYNLAAPLMRDTGDDVFHTHPDMFMAAVSLTARASGFELPNTIVRYDSRDPVASMARQGRFKYRQVLLRGAWWKGPCVPLLAFLANNGLPVALIPHGDRYRWIDPRDGSRHLVKARDTDRFASRAYHFYRPLPEKPLGLRDLLSYGMKDVKSDLVMVLLTGAVGGMLAMLVPFATRHLFDTTIPDGNRTDLVMVCLGLVAAAFAATLFELTRSFALLRMEGRMDGNLQAAVWDRLLSLPVPFFRQFSAGDLSQRAMGIGTIRAMLSASLVTTMVTSLFSFFVLLQLFLFNAQLAWTALILIVLSQLTLPLNILILRNERRLADLSGRISGLLFQLIGGMAKLRMSGSETRAYAVWAERFGQKKSIAWRTGLLNLTVRVWQGAYPFLGSLTIFAYTILLLRQPMTTGSFLGFMAAYGHLLGAALALSKTATSSLGIVPLLERVKPILRAEPEQSENKADPGPLSGAVDVHHLSFRYQSDGPPVLRDISLKINPGEFTAVVGASGSGKSTLLRLMLGFETPENGAIYYDGKELAGLDIGAVRRQAGVVLQHARLLSGDIYTNITGSLPLSLEHAWEAATMSGVADDIREMPMGMHTIIGEDGGAISGGQRQRILIARALVTRPRMLFFDEATSALDNETQAAVSQNLERLHVTRVVIAHRLSTIRNADRIFVLDRGRLVESGTFDELMEQDGFFTRLAKRQMTS
ncbi:MAG: NHLP bacteriocin export ABC transporter permease/ATPase subunit [Acidobacteriota bacterium]|nr:NHLP bacteriocin export ABC transporter permease/ATPase subunit [Acidobacteriota bacterium]